MFDHLRSLVTVFLELINYSLHRLLLMCMLGYSIPTTLVQDKGEWSGLQVLAIYVLQKKAFKAEHCLLRAKLTRYKRKCAAQTVPPTIQSHTLRLFLQQEVRSCVHVRVHTCVRLEDMCVRVYACLIVYIVIDCGIMKNKRKEIHNSITTLGCPIA